MGMGLPAPQEGWDFCLSIPTPQKWSHCLHRVPGWDFRWCCCSGKSILEKEMQDLEMEERSGCWAPGCWELGAALRQPGWGRKSLSHSEMFAEPVVEENSCGDGRGDFACSRWLRDFSSSHLLLIYYVFNKGEKVFSLLWALSVQWAVRQWHGNMLTSGRTLFWPQQWCGFVFLVIQLLVAFLSTTRMCTWLWGCNKDESVNVVKNCDLASILATCEVALLARWGKGMGLREEVKRCWNAFLTGALT